MGNRRLTADVLIALAFALASWALYGYTLGAASNQLFYLPWVLSKLQPALFAGDPAVASAGRAPTFFWLLLAKMAGFSGLGRACFRPWFLSRVGFGLATIGITRRLGGDRLAQGISLLLALLSSELFVSSPFAGDPLLHPFLDQTSFCWPFALGAVLLWWDDRRHAAAFALGLLANLNPLVAEITASWLAVDAALAGDTGLREAAELAALAAAGALPLAVRLVVYPARPALDVVLAATPNTYLPGVWPKERWLRAGAILVAASALCSAHTRRKTLFRMLAAAGILWLAAGLASFGTAARPLVQLQWFRLDVVVVWLALAVAGPVLAGELLRAEALAFSGALAAAWGLVTLYGSPMLAVWSAAIVVNHDRRTRLGLGLTVLLYSCLSLTSGLALFRLSPTAALTTAFLSALLASSAVLSTAQLSRVVRAALAALPLGTAAIMSILVSVVRAGSPPVRSTQPVEAWARTTSPDAKFVVPPDWSGFRLHAWRPVYFEWQDFTMALWDREAATGWKERSAQLGLDWSTFPAWRERQILEWDLSVIAAGSPPLRAPYRWTPADAPRLAALGRKAGAMYLVAPTDSKLPLPVAFQGGGLTVHRLDGAAR
jgi:hypothetical protein